MRQNLDKSISPAFLFFLFWSDKKPFKIDISKRTHVALKDHIM
jgi:hypothetical protein